MLLKLTLASRDSTDDDVLVDADASATVRALAEAISTRNPRSSGGPASTGVTLQVERLGEAHSLAAERALGDAALRSGDRVSVQPEPTHQGVAADLRAPAATLVVAAGPDAGRRFPLRPGANEAGRSPESDVVLADPMVSKRHARFTVSDVVEVVDLDSVNGVLVNDMLVARAVIRAGDQVLLGDSVLCVEGTRAGGADHGSSISFNRSPYLDPTYEGRKVQAPEPPSRPSPTRFPAIALVAPLLFGIILFAFTRQLISVVFIALSPIMLIGSWFDAAQLAPRDARGDR